MRCYSLFLPAYKRKIPGFTSRENSNDRRFLCNTLVNTKDRSYELKTGLREGKFDIPIDSLDVGVYSLVISFPWPSGKSNLTYRDEGGKVITPKTKVRNIAFKKDIYINPDQSLRYHIKPQNTITEAMIRNFDIPEYRKTNLYFFETITSSEDANLYDKLDRAYQYYTGLSYHTIIDSLYLNSRIPDKIYNDFHARASELNYRYNYPVFLKEKRALLAEHLDNPVAALDILGVSAEEFRKEAKAYENLLNRMVGRAKESPYFTRAMIKLAELSFALEEGELLPLPTGKTPESTDLVYSPSAYRYTLLEFWASWCGPCRANNAHWNKLLADHQTGGFQILGVSLDVSLDNWKKAIVEDKLGDWLHLADMEDGFKGTNALTYGIQSIPFNILIDRQGRIVKKDIAPEELELFLKQDL